MSYAETIVPEFDHEMANTRKVLERVPDEKMDWRPTPTSQTIGWNASHLAAIPTWGTIILSQEGFDIATAPRKAPPATREQILVTFDENVADLRQALASASDEHVARPWTLRSGEHTVFTLPRARAIRAMVLSHTIHHRAMLIMNLRLNGIKVPGMYGPGDE